MGLTDAHVTFTNELGTPLEVRKTASVAMEKDLPDVQTVPAYQTSKLQHINTSDISVLQSSFTLAFSDETVKVDLGRELYVTDATWSATDGKIGGLLAPINSMNNGVDFRLWFFACDGSSVDYLNRYLISAAKLVPQTLVAHPITVPLPPVLNKSSVTLTKLEIPEMKCVYASILALAAVAVSVPGSSAGVPRVTADALGSNKVTVTAILNTSLMASGSVSLFDGSFTSVGELALTEVSMLARVVVDLSSPPHLSAVVESLAISIGEWSLSSDIFESIEKAFPWLAGILSLVEDSYHLAALFNTDPVNSQIVELVNTILKGLLGSDGTAFFESLAPVADPETVKSANSIPKPMSAQAPEHDLLFPNTATATDTKIINHPEVVGAERPSLDTQGKTDGV
ncbi:uncharacterized protein LY79DRAFT_582677 [Colletotrichum navitas]|uniref:Uncharacterized protein n=1 Tax=Colletotrichum navitas TaxID=681940 RepID=A0AAD8V209_9PEZI|nr:uncharacterized protein LY79DRAFT_582677 [Colletotrichum navitas]KAK1579234.1 hypothetical protein LY79DRAFT_582677 [Colletotrichum navitas]